MIYFKMKAVIGDNFREKQQAIEMMQIYFSLTYLITFSGRMDSKMAKSQVSKSGIKFMAPLRVDYGCSLKIGLLVM